MYGVQGHCVRRFTLLLARPRAVTGCTWSTFTRRAGLQRNIQRALTALQGGNSECTFAPAFDDSTTASSVLVQNHRNLGSRPTWSRSNIVACGTVAPVYARSPSATRNSVPPDLDERGLRPIVVGRGPHSRRGDSPDGDLHNGTRRSPRGPRLELRRGSSQQKQETAIGSPSHLDSKRANPQQEKCTR